MTDLPTWRVRTSWASTPGHRLITVFRWRADYHDVGGYAAIRSFHTYQQVRAYLEGAAT